MEKEKRLSAAVSIAAAAVLLFFAGLNLPHLKTALYNFVTGQTDFLGFTQLVHDSYVADTIGQYEFVDLNGLFMRATGRRIDNSVMKLKNGMLTEEHTPPCDVTELSAGINALAKYVQDKGTPFLYVQLPYKLDLNSSLVIEGKRDFSHDNADRLIEALDADVDIVDLRPLLCSDAASIEKNFFRTDHHWNYYGAFQGFSELLRQLDKRFPDCGIDLALGDLNNWESHTVENWLLGSRGRRTGRFFAGLDDMTYYIPRFETEITCDIPEAGMHYEGDFSAANLRPERIAGKKNPYEKDAYGLYMGGDYRYVHQENAGATGKLKILLIKDSYSLPLMAYLSTAFETVDSVDPRYSENRAVVNMIDELNPDVVILALNPNIIHLCPEDYSDYGLK